MKREAFEHTIRAVGGILDETELLVIGSQAIHASAPDNVPPIAERSMETDIASFRDPSERKATQIDGAIGEMSMFHESFGYYAQGVTRFTAILPRGWEYRLIRYETPSTNGVVAWCLDIHDLWIAKAIAYREKDIEFCAFLMSEGLVSADTLIRRLNEVEYIEAIKRSKVAEFIDQFAGPAKQGRP